MASFLAALAPMAMSAGNQMIGSLIHGKQRRPQQQQNLNWNTIVPEENQQELVRMGGVGG